MTGNSGGHSLTRDPCTKGPRDIYNRGMKHDTVGSHERPPMALEVAQE